MCTESKQILKVIAAALIATVLTVAAVVSPAFAGEPVPSVMALPTAPASAGSIAIGAADGGVTDRAYVTAPPNYHYIVERAPGSFVDCGAGMDARVTDASGRSVTPLSCGVTLTETIVIPAAASSARLIVHY